MDRDGKFFGQLILLVLFACFMFPSLLYKSFAPAASPGNDPGIGSSRTRRSVELETNNSTGPSSSPPAQNCVKPSIYNFPGDFMSQHQRKKGGALIHVLLAMYLFSALAIVCEDFFVPSLEQIAEKLKISYEVAGAALMPIGTSTPDLIFSIVGVLIATSDLGEAAIVGSAVFNNLFVVAICGLFAGSTLRLSRWPLLRVSLCYLVSIAALIAVTYDQKVYWYEALGLVCIFSLYIVILYFDTALEGFFHRLLKIRKENTDTEINSEELTPLLPLRQVPQQDVQIIDQNNNSPFSFPQGFISRVTWIIVLPVKCLLYMTTPDCRKESWRKWYLASFSISLVWIALLSYALVWMTSIIGFTLGISDVILGLTFLAAGGSATDLLSSLAVARQGYGDMAVSNAIGCNVCNILLGLGLPWLLKTTFVDFGGHVDVQSGSMSYTSICLLGTVFVSLVCVVLNRWVLNKCLGIVFLVLYLTFIVVAILFGLNVFGDFNLPTCQT